MIPCIVQEGDQRSYRAAFKLEDRDLAAAHKKVVGMQSKVNENRRGYQTRHTQKNCCTRQLSPHSFLGRCAQRQQKTQAEEEKQEWCEKRRNVGVGKQPGAYARQHDVPPTLLTPPSPKQRKAQT